MNQKRASLIAIAAGVILIVADVLILPLILVLTGSAGVAGGSLGIVGGAGLPTLLLLLREAHRGIPRVLTVVGVLCIAVGIAVLILKKKYGQK